MKETSDRKLSMKYIAVVLCCAGIFAAQSGTSNCLGIFYSSLADHIDSGVGTVSFFVTLKGLASTLVNILIPYIMYRKKIIGKLFLAGGVCEACGLALATAAVKPFSLALCFLLQGIGDGLLTSLILITVLHNWFNKGAATCLALTTCSSGLFGAVFNPVLASFMTAFGWQKALLFLAVCAFVLTLPAAFFVTLTPAEKNDVPYGDEELRKSETESTAAAAGSVRFDSSMVFICTVSVLCAIFLSQGMHISTFGGSLGATVAFSALMTSCAMVGNIVFKLSAGVMYDRFGIRRTNNLIFAISIAGGIILAFYRNCDWILLAGCFLFGVNYGFCNIGFPELAQRVFKKEDYAPRYSIASTTMGLVYQACGTVYGLFYDWTGAYDLTNILCLAAIIICALIVIIYENRKGIS